MDLVTNQLLTKDCVPWLKTVLNGVIHYQMQKAPTAWRATFFYVLDSNTPSNEVKHAWGFYTFYTASLHNAYMHGNVCFIFTVTTWKSYWNESLDIIYLVVQK
jgi:hypothetical protein